MDVPIFEGSISTSFAPGVAARSSVTFAAMSFVLRPAGPASRRISGMWTCSTKWNSAVMFPYKNICENLNLRVVEHA